MKEPSICNGEKSPTAGNQTSVKTAANEFTNESHNVSEILNRFAQNYRISLY
jgi:hypothetical protein